MIIYSHKAKPQHKTLTHKRKGVTLLSLPYSKGQYWYIKFSNGYEMQFVTYEEAWDFYKSQN